MSAARSRSEGSGIGTTFEPVEEILAEPPGRHLLLQLAIGGRHHADVHADVGCAADAVKRLLLQKRSSLAWSIGAISPISSRNSAAAVSHFEQAALLVVGVGKGPALVSEQLALEQILRRAEHVMFMNGRLPPGRWRSRTFAARSLPVPLSPVSSTVEAGLEATFLMSA